MINRRGLITGLIAFAAAPAIVRASSLMPVKVIKPTITIQEYADYILKAQVDVLYGMMVMNVMCGHSISKITHTDKGGITYTPITDIVRVGDIIRIKE